MVDRGDIDDLAILAEFAQLALARARAASARAEKVEAEGGDPSVHLIAFDRMGRAMRLALSLRRRFADEGEGRAARRVQARKEGLRAALTPAIRVHAPFAERQDLDWALAHRLETEAETLASLSFEAGLARLCGLLGLPAGAGPAASGEGSLSRPPTVFGAAEIVEPCGFAPSVFAPSVADHARRAAATGPPRPGQP